MDHSIAFSGLSSHKQGMINKILFSLDIYNHKIYIPANHWHRPNSTESQNKNKVFNQVWLIILGAILVLKI